MTAASYKEGGLVVVVAALSIALFIAAAYAIPDINGRLVVGITAIILALLWVGTAALAFFLIRHWTSVLLITLISAAAVMVVGLSWGAVGGGLLLLLSCLSARRAVRRDAENARFIQTVPIFRSATRLLVVGITLALAGLAVPFLQDSLENRSLQVTAEQAQYVIAPLTPVLEGFIPDLSADSDVDDIIDTQLRRQGIDPADVSPAQRDEFRQQVSRELNQPVSGGESLSEIVAGQFNNALQRVTEANALTIAIVAAILMFLAVRAFIPVITWVLLAEIAAALWIGKQTGLINSTTQTIEIEQLTL